MDTTTSDTAESPASEPHIPIQLLVQYRSEPGADWGKYIVGVQFGTLIIDLPLKLADADHKAATLYWAQKRLKEDDVFRAKVIKDWNAHIAYIEKKEKEREALLASWRRSETRSKAWYEKQEKLREARKTKHRAWLLKNGPDQFGDGFEDILKEYLRMRKSLARLEKELIKRNAKLSDIRSLKQGGLSYKEIAKISKTTQPRLIKLPKVATRIEEDQKFYDKF